MVLDLDALTIAAGPPRLPLRISMDYTCDRSKRDIPMNQVLHQLKVLLPANSSEEYLWAKVNINRSA
jgi:hypothetical protein